MQYQVNEPVFTRVLASPRELDVRPRSVYITGQSVEERSTYTAELESRCDDVLFVHVVDVDRFSMRVVVSRRGAGERWSPESFSPLRRGGKKEGSNCYTSTLQASRTMPGLRWCVQLGIAMSQHLSFT